MAAVRVDSVAFSDPRIVLLGEIAGYNQFEALGRLAHLWSACTERESAVMPEPFVRGALGPKGVEALIESGLGERTAGGCRVRGCEGRTDWLSGKRKASKAGGKATQAKFSGQRGPDEGQTRAEAGPNEGPLTLTLTTASKEKGIAAAPPPPSEIKDPPLPNGQTKPRKRTPRDDLFDAIVEVTASNPTVNASHIGKIVNLFLKANPPVTPADVRKLPDLLSWAKEEERPITVGEVQKYIGRAQAVRELTDFERQHADYSSETGKWTLDARMCREPACKRCLARRGSKTNPIDPLADGAPIFHRNTENDPT